jgi:hypothetical protein
MTCPVLTAYAATVFAWGGGDKSSVTLTPAEPPAVAVVQFANTLTYGSPSAPFSLTLGPLTISVSIDFGAGLEPETMHVEAPEGFIASPPSLVVPDWTTGTVTIFCADAMGMG